MQTVGVIFKETAGKVEAKSLSLNWSMVKTTAVNHGVILKVVTNENILCSEIQQWYDGQNDRWNKA